MELDGVGPHIVTMYRAFDITGVLLMGIIGGTIARQRGFDIVGFLFCALFSSLGGGMVRDVLIGQGPVAAIYSPEYLYLAFTGALIALCVNFKGRKWERVLAHGDGVISSLWAATGCVKALAFGLPVLACVMMGVFTAVGGGMIRDVVTGRVPSVFGGNVPIVIPAISCTVAVLVSHQLGYISVGMVIGPIVCFAITTYGYWSGWKIPSNPEWAPVNVAAGMVERGSRKVARGLEPTKLRSWRHRQMERALQRRLEKSQRASAADNVAAQQMLSRFTTSSGVDSHVDNKATGVAHPSAADAGSTPADSVLDSRRLAQELIDVMLADEALTDELLTRLQHSYQDRSGLQGEDQRP